MSEQQIKDGYERLGSGLMPPADTLERVTRAVRTRRRRRTAATGGAAVVTVLVAGGLALMLQDDAGSRTDVATESPSPAPLTLTRADGSTYAFPDITVSCTAPSFPNSKPFDTLPGRIWLSSPIRVEDPTVPEDDMVVTQPFILFEGIVDKIDGKTFQLPVEAPFTYDGSSSDDRPFTLFAADPAEPRANEVSSAEGDAKGTVHVVRASCDPTPVLELVVDTTLGSEVSQGTEKVAGTYR